MVKVLKTTPKQFLCLQLGCFSKEVALKMRRDGLTLMRYVGCGSDDRFDGDAKRGLPGLTSRRAARCWQHHFLEVEVGWLMGKRIR